MRIGTRLVLLSGLLAGLLSGLGACGEPGPEPSTSIGKAESGEAKVEADAVSADESGTKSMALATFGGGCFWCVEAVFAELRGVASVVPGYSGGTVENPTYDQVCGKGTGHAEVVQIAYDASVVPYERLLQVFFQTHDPTTVDRQGNDVGPQYRSVVFAHDASQRETANAVIQALSREGAYDAPIVTQVVAFEHFYPAEDYHHDYFARNPQQGYCRAIVGPKVEKFRKAFKPYLKSEH